MRFTFDLISDLHIETWDDFNWEDQATSPFCVVAGDIARDHNIVLEVLEHLSECYGSVFYIDGNDEHRYNYLSMGESYRSLVEEIKKLDDVVYMQDNVIVINGVAILGTNGWWGFDFDTNLDREQSQAWWAERVDVPVSVAENIENLARQDAAYMANSVKKLQTHNDVKKIVCVTHTVPAPWIVEHDIDLVDTWRFNCMGNRYMQRVLDEDTENKLHTWCFGHYHKSVDRDFAGIRWVNNCRGRGDTPWSQPAYYPKRIVVDY